MLSYTYEFIYPQYSLKRTKTRRHGGDVLLDNIQQIKKIDSQNMFSVLEKFPEHCEDAIKRTESLILPERFRGPEKIVVLGMGGSAIGGDLFRNWLYDKAEIPVIVSREYILPKFVDKETLVFAISYSGNTEETLSGFLYAVKKSCMIISITSNGRLQDFSRQLGVPTVEIPSGMAPRAAISYLFIPLLIIFEKLGVISNAREEIIDAIELLKRIREEIRLSTPTEENIAKKSAMEIKGTVPLVYGQRYLESVAKRMKCQFNENSKSLSGYDFFPELNHNETVGWEGPEIFTKMFSVILLRDPDEPPELKNRIDITIKLILEKKAKKVHQLTARGSTKLAKMLSLLYIGDFLSVYLAILYGVDPTPVKIITRLKKELEKKIDIVSSIEKEIRELAKK